MQFLLHKPLYCSSIQPISSGPAFSASPSLPVFPPSASSSFLPALWLPEQLDSSVLSTPQSSVNTGILPVYASSKNVSAAFHIFHISVFLHSLPDPADNNLHAVCSLVHYFHHKCAFHHLISPFLCFSFYFPCVAGSPSHSFGYPKPAFREYFLLAFAPFAVFLLMPSALVYPAIPHPLQHFSQGHALPNHICRKHPAI